MYYIIDAIKTGVNQKSIDTKLNYKEIQVLIQSADVSNAVSKFKNKYDDYDIMNVAVANIDNVIL